MNDLIGKKVTIYSVAATVDPSDVGTLEKIEGQWIWLRKSEREVLIFNVDRIRAVKPFEPL
jgi:ferredoxin-fold anticodon binding domain-containing protein